MQRYVNTVIYPDFFVKKVYQYVLVQYDFPIGNLFLSLVEPKSNPHRDSNLGRQNERKTKNQLNYPSTSDFFLFKFKRKNVLHLHKILLFYYVM